MRKQRLELRSGGGLSLTLFGIPFLLAGLWILYLGFSGNLQREGGGQASIFFFLPFGAIFTTAGAALSMGRNGTTLDPGRGTVTSWWGLLSVPFHKSDRGLSEFDEVVLKKEIVRSKNSRRTVFRVYLHGQGEPLMLTSCSTFLESRRDGEKAARAVKLPLRDSASDNESIRQSDELDMSLRDQILKRGEELELASPPVPCRSSYTIDDQQVVFELPPCGFRAKHILSIASSAFMLIVVTLFFGFQFLAGGVTDIPPFIMAFALILLSLFALPLVGAVFSSTKEALSRQRVILNKKSLEVKRQGPLGGSVQRIPLQQLEELDFALGGQVLHARSDHAVIAIGEGLSKQEVSWLKNTMEYILVKL